MGNQLPLFLEARLSTQWHQSFDIGPVISTRAIDLPKGPEHVYLVISFSMENLAPT